MRDIIADLIVEYVTTIDNPFIILIIIVSASVIIVVASYLFRKIIGPLSTRLSTRFFRSDFLFVSIIALIISMVVLVTGHYYLAGKYAADNPRHTDAVSIVNLEGITVDDVTAVGLIQPGSELELVYRKTDGAWRLTVYRDAYAQADRIEGIVRDILESGGVPADRRGREDSFYGIDENSLRIKLYAENGEPVADVICGRQLPGMWQRDSYVRVTGREEIYHINGNPVPKIGARGSLPPLVDPKIIPSALGSLGEPAQVIFEPPGVMPVMRIERRERQPSEEEGRNMPPAMRDMKHYDWYAISESEEAQDAQVAEVKLDERSAGSYINFIRNITYNRISRLEELPGGAGGPAERRIVVLFEKSQSGAEEGDEETKPEIRKEYIEIRGDDGKGNRLVYFSGTGFTASVDPRKAQLLFPDMEILKNPQPSPSVFDSAESGGGGPPLFE
ncbi:hypothetical protein ACFLQK_00540 [bacterium]